MELKPQSQLVKTFIIFLGLLSASWCQAQKKLTISHTGSLYTYLYKISDKQLHDLYRNIILNPNDKDLKNPIDSFKTGQVYNENKLSPGNYLELLASENEIHYRLIEKHTAFINSLGSVRNEAVIFTDRDGNTIRNPEAIKYNDRPIRVNTSGIYILHPKKSEIVEIDYQGVANFFKMRSRWQPVTFLSKTWRQRQWAKIKRLFKKQNDRYGNRQQDDRYTGFMIFNKPQYKPHDTVRIKAYILNTKTKEPLTASSLLLKLSDSYDNDDEKLLGTIKSYRPGAFETSFILADSLDLRLDNRYTINFEDPEKTMAKDKDNDEDEDANGKKKHMIYVSGNFQYEEYELKSIDFSARTDTVENSPGVPMKIYFKAADENNIPIPDGRVVLTVTPWYNPQFMGKHVFLPDTLWQHEVKLDPVGETRITLPDSIFPAARIPYVLTSDFYNSANEHRSVTKYLTYIPDSLRVKTNLVADTLKINALLLGRNVPLMASVSAIISPADTLFTKAVMLPYAIKVNPGVDTYHIETKAEDILFNLKNTNDALPINGWQKGDTVFIKADNSAHMHLWYNIYEGSKLVRSGESDTLNYQFVTTFKGNVTCSVNYLWAGETHTFNKIIPYSDEGLRIKVVQPFSVYPGQNVTTQIQINDDKGSPVPNADVTAWALTSKFDNYSLPRVPYLGKVHYNIRPAQRITMERFTDTWANNLDWERWRRDMRLDTMEYYKFTHTDSIYRVNEDLNPGDDTQIAPFAVKNGQIIPVQVLYIDERPVYFSQAEQLQHYSFRVDSGRHTIRIRTAHSEIVLRNIYVAEGKKLILSALDSSINSHIQFTKKPDTLENYEADLLDKYMIKVTDNFGDRLATLDQAGTVFMLNQSLNDSRRYNSYQSDILTGPLSYNIATFNLADRIYNTFLTEPDFVYTFTPGLIKQKSIQGRYPFVKTLWSPGISDYTQYALNYNSIDSLWQNYLDMRSHTVQLFRNVVINDKDAGILQIGYSAASYKCFVKNIIIYRYDDPDFMRVYAGDVTEFGRLQKGDYRILFLLKKNNYALVEHISVKPYGRNYYEVDLKPLPKDSVISKIDKIIDNREKGYNPGDNDLNNDALKLKEAFSEKYVNEVSFTGTIQGTVISKDDGIPIPGVSIKIKGTSNGVATNSAGRFKLKVPAKGKIIVAAIGYVTQEIPIVHRTDYNIQLITSSQQLNEVVVTGALGVKRTMRSLGYATAQIDNKEMTDVISGLEGKVSGLQVNLENGAVGSTTKIVLRGNRSIQPGDEALVVIDGMIMTQEDLKKLAPSDVENISLLKGGLAAAVYGSRAANGVIIIVTKKKSQADKVANAQSGEGSIRKNFSDYAYWQPKLITDAEGKASFTTIMPDDITSWRTFVVAVDGAKATGVSEKLIKSFKPLSASFISPAFAVQGDRSSAIGKVMNYNAVPEKLTRSFTYNGNLIKQDSFVVANSKIDTLHFTANNYDSLTFKYFIKKDDGYFDGEERNIPVIKQGVEETKGVFAVLKGDTTLNIRFDGALGKVTLHAEASILPTLIAEADKLRDYKYLCNEQLASKLKGLLVEKRIKTYLGEPFTHDKNINDVIRLINENGGKQGLWGWWKDSADELWISLHVIETLLEAGNEKYITNLNEQRVIDYLVYQLESYKGQDKIMCLQLLNTLHAKVDYQKYLTVIDNEYKAEENPEVYDHFRILLLKQQAGIAVNTDELLKTMHKTLFGNVYWGEDSYRFFDNSVQVTLLAYRIFRNEGKHPEILEKIRGYLLEQRHDGGWRNTYESSLILEDILPDVLVGDKQIKTPQLKLNGAVSATVDKFPYTTTFSGAGLSVTKTGTLPIYITGYQQFWNTNPEKVSKDFTVDTWFERNGEKVTRLKGAQRVQLKAKVTAHGDGDFVMVEIPIPAGCSYESKAQSWENNEVHREYFKEKVSIFCRKLKQGTYTFTIDLMPRFSGEYNLNPAKAELMYFPVFYGREGMGKVVIGD